MISHFPCECIKTQARISLNENRVGLEARGYAGGAERWTKQRAHAAVFGLSFVTAWKQRRREVKAAKTEQELDERERNTDQFFRLSRASNGAPTSNVIPRLLGGVLVMLCASHQPLENKALISYAWFHISD